MILEFLATLIAFILLIYSADVLAQSAITLSKRYHLSARIVGVMIGLITSLPEIISMSTSAFKGFPNMVVGNVFGSNITNLSMAFALPLLFFHASTHQQKNIHILSTIWLIVPIILLVWVGLDGALSKLEGIFLAVCSAIYTYSLIKIKPRDLLDDTLNQSNTQKTEQNKNLPLTWLLGLGAVVIMQLSANWLIDSASHLMKILNISEYIIGAFVVGLGTSLPEIASGFALLKKGQLSMLLGGIIGSNAFNIMLGLGLATSIAAIKIDPNRWQQDLIILIILTTLTFIYLKQHRGLFSLFVKMMMVGIYIAYIHSTI